MLSVEVHRANWSDARWIGVFIAGLSALLAVRIAALYFNATDLFFDEAQYWYWSLDPAFGYYSKPPLIAWLIRMSTDSCGLSEFCIRLPSPLIHSLTSVAVFFLGRHLYGTAIGAISGLVFATLPGVSVSSGLISTDVPLLLFWAIALFAFAMLFETRAWWPAVLLGCALGLGLNAKYAMAWFILCAGVYLALTPERRVLLKDVRLYVALGIGVLLIVPNIMWNLDNGFATFAHTADNAKWGGPLLHPRKALEFFGSQFGVFGPILFASLLIVSWRAYRGGLPEPDRLLLAFSLPVVIAITLQAFLSRAHPNWAAVAYVGATVLVTATMVRDVAWPWLKASLALHVALLAAFSVSVAVAGRVPLPVVGDPFSRTLGWQAVADATRKRLAEAKAAGRPFAAIITDDRQLSSELLYYLRDDPTPLFAWWSGGRPRDHFELTRPYQSGRVEPVLLVSLIGEPSPARRDFQVRDKLGEDTLPAGLVKTRRVVFFALSGYKPE